MQRTPRTTLPRSLVATLLLLAGLSLAGAAHVSAAPTAPVTDGDVELVTVLIEFEPRPGLSSTEARSGRASTMVAPWGGRVERVFRHLPYASVEVPSSVLEELRSAPDVREVHPVLTAEPLLDESLPVIGALDGDHEVTGLTGAGQTVAVLDTGIQAEHPFFAGEDGTRVVGEACFTSSDDCPNGQSEQVGPGAGQPLVFQGVKNSHGTHVAGIAAGFRDGTDPARGVAPRSGLVSVQVFGDHGHDGPTTNSADLAYALEWIYEVHEQFDIAAVNLSLGGHSYETICDHVNGSAPILDAVDLLRASDVVTVAASGNGEFRDAMSWPACLSNIVSVGATTNSDAFSWFTNVSEVTDIMAPGVGIRSSVVDNGYGSGSGTSMAAPHAAGAVALLKEAQPGAAWEDLRMALRSSGTLLDDDRSDGIHTAIPRLDLAAAVDAVGGIASPPDLGSSYVPLTPSRVLDTRDGTGSVKAPLGAREQRSVQVAGVGGVPSSGVGAVVLNVTAVNATRTGYVTVWPAGVERPLASTLNPEPGMVLANEIVAKVGSDGRVEVYNRNGTVDLIFDVVGYLPSSDA